MSKSQSIQPSGSYLHQPRILHGSFDRTQQTQCIQELLATWHSRHDTYLQLVQLSIACLSIFFGHAASHSSIQGLMQGCRAEAEQVLQQATHAALGGSKPLQLWKDSQASQATPEACDLLCTLCMMLHMHVIPVHALYIAHYVC